MISRANFRAVARRTGCASLLLGAAAVAIYFLPGVSPFLQYDRSAMAAGEVWRTVTCHFTHWSFDHLAWDAGALVVLGLLCEAPYRRAFAACMGLSAVLVPLAVWTFIPEMETYRGLSGIDSALFVLLAVSILGESLVERRRAWAAGSALVLVAFAGKIAFECLSGATLFVDSAATSMTPVPLAHLVGGLTGAICGGARFVPRKSCYSSQVFIASNPSAVSE